MFWLQLMKSFNIALCSSNNNKKKSSGSTWPRSHIFLRGSPWFDAVLGSKGLMLSVCYRLWTGFALREGQMLALHMLCIRWPEVSPQPPKLPHSLEAYFSHPSHLPHLAVWTVEESKIGWPATLDVPGRVPKLYLYGPNGEQRKKKQFGFSEQALQMSSDSSAEVGSKGKRAWRSLVINQKNLQHG